MARSINLCVQRCAPSLDADKVEVVDVAKVYVLPSKRPCNFMKQMVWSPSQLYAIHTCPSHAMDLPFSNNNILSGIESAAQRSGYSTDRVSLQRSVDSISMMTLFGRLFYCTTNCATMCFGHVTLTAAITVGRIPASSFELLPGSEATTSKLRGCSISFWMTPPLFLHRLELERFQWGRQLIPYNPLQRGVMTNHDGNHFRRCRRNRRHCRRGRGNR